MRHLTRRTVLVSAYKELEGIERANLRRVGLLAKAG